MIPAIAQAYQNDPRTKAALDLMATSTAPVATGGWGIAEGIARALSGIGGGLIERSQNKRYGEDEQDLLKSRAKDIPSEIARRLSNQSADATGPVQFSPGALSPNMGRWSGQPGGSSFNLPEWAKPQQSTMPLRGDPNGDHEGMGGSGPNPNLVNTSTLPGAPVANNTGLQPGAIPNASYTPPSTPSPQGVASFTDPLAGRGRITSKYGQRRAPIAGASTFHNGVDMAAPKGTPVLAAGDGRVVQAWDDTTHGGGNSIILQHADGTKTGYAHLSQIGVKPGDIVQAGQPIGAVGATGRATGPHLHFTVRDARGRRIDPSTVNLSGKPSAIGNVPLENVAPESATIQVAGAATTGPQQVQLPDVPDPVQKPTAPDVVPATQSERLLNAYRMIRRANRYEAADAQTMLDKGLGEQSDYNEAYATRKQHVADRQYELGMEGYNQDRSARTTSALSARNTNLEQRQTYNNTHQINTEQNAFTTQRDAKLNDYDMAKARFQSRVEYGLHKLDNDAAWQRTKAEIDSRRATAEDKQAALRDGFFNTRAGRDMRTAYETAQDQESTVNGQLDAFINANKQVATGGTINNGLNGLRRYGNPNLQAMEGVTSSLGIAATTALKGSISDKEEKLARDTVPHTGNTLAENQRRADWMRAAFARKSEFHGHAIDAMIQGSNAYNTFRHQWDAFRNSHTVGDGVTYDAWLANRPRFDASGRRVN